MFAIQIYPALVTKAVPTSGIAPLVVVSWSGWPINDKEHSRHAHRAFTIIRQFYKHEPEDLFTERTQWQVDRFLGDQDRRLTHQSASLPVNRNAFLAVNV